jgi:hypothetical protein
MFVGNYEGETLVRRNRRKWEGDIKVILKKQGVRTWTGFIWLRIESGGGLLLT